MNEQGLTKPELLKAFSADVRHAWKHMHDSGRNYISFQKSLLSIMEVVRTGDYIGVPLSESTIDELSEHIKTLLSFHDQGCVNTYLEVFVYNPALEN